MTKSPKNTQELIKDKDYWTNEVEYFEDASEGLQMAYAILQAMLQKAREELEKVTKD